MEAFGDLAWAYRGISGNLEWYLTPVTVALRLI